MQNHKPKNTLIFIAIILIILIAGYFIYSYLNKAENQNESPFPITREGAKADFANQEKITQSETIPPQNIKDRYNEYIVNSQTAIVSGIPSSEQSPDLSDDYLNIATSFNILGQYAEAETAYLAAIEAFPDKYLLHYNLALLYETMRQYQNSALKFYDVMEKFPADYRVYDKFANLYINYSTAADKLEKAEKLYKAGMKNSDNPKYLYQQYVGFAENDLQDYEKALWAEREYQKITGSKEMQKIERLEKMLDVK